MDFALRATASAILMSAAKVRFQFSSVTAQGKPAAGKAPRNNEPHRRGVPLLLLVTLSCGGYKYGGAARPQAVRASRPD